MRSTPTFLSISVNFNTENYLCAFNNCTMFRGTCQASSEDRLLVDALLPAKTSYYRVPGNAHHPPRIACRPTAIKPMNCRNFGSIFDAILTSGIFRLADKPDIAALL